VALVWDIPIIRRQPTQLKMSEVGAWSGGNVTTSSTKIEPSFANSIQFSSGTAGGNIEPSGLVSWYKFEEAGTTCTDEKGNYTGTLSNSAGRFDIGKFGSCMYPNGAYMMSTANSTLGSIASISCWVNGSNYATANVYNHLWSKTSGGNDWLLDVRNIGSGYVVINNYALPFLSSQVPENSWVHLAMTWKNNDFLRLYINGSLIGSTATTNITESTGSLFVGYYNWVSTYYWCGKIDDFKVWNRDLTATEVASEFAITTGSYGVGAGGSTAIQNTNLTESWGALASNWDLIGWINPSVTIGSLEIDVASDTSFTNYNRYVKTNIGSGWNLLSIDLGSPISSGGTLDWSDIKAIKFATSGNPTIITQDWAIGAVANS